MRRRIRRSASGTVAANSLSPLLRIGSLLFVLGLIYSWAKIPQNWKWLTDNSQSPVAATSDRVVVPNPPQSGKLETSPETIVPGPTDRDRSEAAEGGRLFEAVSDRTKLEKVEMPAYWRCLKWARAQSFADLERRAADHVLFTQFFEQPERFRGKLVRLRLHIQRILDWSASENSAGVKQVYEAWGWTDDSKSHPYVVVFSELPAGLKLGDNLQEEGVFVGYFLKTIAYTAFNRNQAAPLLLGRLHALNGGGRARPIAKSNEWFWLCAVGLPLALLFLTGVWLRLRRVRHTVVPKAATADEAEMENWFREESQQPPGERPDFGELGRGA